MLCSRFIRALAAVSLVVSLFAIPAAADAAPRLDRGGDDGSLSLVVRIREWIGRIWGQGGPSVDPGGMKPPPPLTGEDPEPPPAPAPVTAAASPAPDGELEYAVREP